tara:strand:- start:268 stop:1650 length:1383 start_codon:yes stop_codon:yes gene_type:complete
MAEFSAPKTLSAARRQIKKLVEEIQLLEARGDADAMEQAKAYREQVKQLDEILGVKTKINKIDNDGLDTSKGLSYEYGVMQSKAAALGEELKDTVESIPLIGGALSKVFKLDDLGENLAEAIQNPLAGMSGSIDEADDGMKKFNRTSLRNPMLALAAAALAIVSAIRFMVKGARDLASDLGIAASQAQDIMLRTKAAQFAMETMGYDSADLKETMKAVVDEFGSLDNLSVSSARQISMMAQDFGTTGDQIIKLNKSMMDLTGMSFEAATNFSQMAADMARTAGVSAGKVIEDMAANANKFAEFSMDGANGLAQAAIEAAKVGANLSMVLGAADKLLELETSLTSQFEAQVLTGKNLNLELARQAALEGDVLGLTQEIQKTVGSLGEIQSMNVIERRAIAEAIGISSDELLKVARGEQIKEQESVQSLQKETNKILISGFSDSIDAYQEGQNKGFTDSLVY